MNPTDILQTAKSLSNAEDRRLLWYLHSRYFEDGGFEKVASEIELKAGGMSNVIKRGGVNHVEPDRSTLIYYLKQFCSGFAPSEHIYARRPTVAGLIGALLEFSSQESEKTKRRFHLTNVGSKVWETLDWCLEERRPCFIEGREGRGKTASTRAWFEAHRGDARYVSLPGLRTQRDFFEAIATAYGVNFSAAKAPNEIRFRVRDMIVRSGLILILDEAHHALPERHRAGRPPLIDWIDCDLCNAGVPVVLVSTPQFGPSLAEFEDRTKWNAGQFRRRFSGRWSCLPEKTTKEDLTALAQKALPRVGSKGIDVAVGYAGTFGRDVSGLFDLVRDAERRVRKAGRADVLYQDLKDAYELDRVPSENAMANAFKRPPHSGPGFTPEDDLPEDCEATAAPLPRNRTPETEAPNRLRGRSAGVLVAT